jgi:hypothetical protein
VRIAAHCCSLVLSPSPRHQSVLTVITAFCQVPSPFFSSRLFPPLLSSSLLLLTLCRLCLCALYPPSSYYTSPQPRVGLLGTAITSSMLGLLLSFSAPNVESLFCFSFLSVHFFSPEQRTGLLLFHRLILALDRQNGQFSEMEEVHSTFGRFSCCSFSSLSSSSALHRRFHHCYFWS